MIEKMKGEVLAPELGEDVRLRFDFHSLAAIEEDLGEEWWLKVQRAWGLYGAGTFLRVLKHGTFIGDDRVKPSQVKVPETVDFALLADKVLDALSYAMRGMSYAEMVQADREEREKAQNPQNAAPNTGLNDPATPLSSTGSASKSSGGSRRSKSTPG